MSTFDTYRHPQPPKSEAYHHLGNAANKTPDEKRAALQHERSDQDFHRADKHIPQKQVLSDEQAKPQPQGQGIRGAGPGEEARGFTEEDIGRHRELDGEQIAPAAEGDVYNAVETKSGASGQEIDLASDLDRKKAEQAPAREAIEDYRKQQFDVGGVLGQRGGPANPPGQR